MEYLYELDCFHEMEVVEESQDDYILQDLILWKIQTQREHQSNYERCKKVY